MAAIAGAIALVRLIDAVFGSTAALDASLAPLALALLAILVIVLGCVPSLLTQYL